jgi:hypothetical protein
VTYGKATLQRRKCHRISPFCLSPALPGGPSLGAKASEATIGCTGVPAAPRTPLGPAHNLSPVGVSAPRKGGLASCQVAFSSASGCQRWGLSPHPSLSRSLGVQGAAWGGGWDSATARTRARAPGLRQHRKEAAETSSKGDLQRCRPRCSPWEGEKVRGLSMQGEGRRMGREERGGGEKRAGGGRGKMEGGRSKGEAGTKAAPGWPSLSSQSPTR